MKAVSLKIENRQVKLLDELSRATQIPKSALIRKGIDLVIRRLKEDVATVELREEIDLLLKEDQKLLKRLSRE